MSTARDVLITGASRGLGLALAREFASRGHDVTLVARDAGRLDQAVASVHAAAKGRIAGLALDMAAPDAVPRLAAALAAAGTKPEILVNKVAATGVGSFASQPAERLAETLALDVRLPVELAHHFLPGMIGRGRGGILNVASLAGVVPVPGLALYSASKHYLVALSRAVAAEVAGTGVTVSVLLPGPIETEFLARAGQQAPNLLERLRAMPPDIVARVAYEGFAAGQTVIVPGLINMIYYAGIRVLPPAILMRGLRGTFLRGEGRTP
jgi:hypothetical protein